MSSSAAIGNSVLGRRDDGACNDRRFATRNRPDGAGGSSYFWSFCSWLGVISGNKFSYHLPVRTDQEDAIGHLDERQVLGLRPVGSHLNRQRPLQRGSGTGTDLPLLGLSR
jgi:hypothetical protein